MRGEDVPVSVSVFSSIVLLLFTLNHSLTGEARCLTFLHNPSPYRCVIPDAAAEIMMIGPSWSCRRIRCACNLVPDHGYRGRKSVLEK